MVVNLLVRPCFLQGWVFGGASMNSPMCFQKKTSSGDYRLVNHHHLKKETHQTLTLMNPATRGQQSTTAESSHNHPMDGMNSILWVLSCVTERTVVTDWLGKEPQQRRGFPGKDGKITLYSHLSVCHAQKWYDFQHRKFSLSKGWTPKWFQGTIFPLLVKLKASKKTWRKNNEGYFLNSKSLICIASKLKSSLKNRQQNGVILDHDHPPFFTKNTPPIYFIRFPPNRSLSQKTHQTTHTHTKPILVFSRGIYSHALATGNGKFVSRIFFKWIPTPGQYLGSGRAPKKSPPAVGWEKHVPRQVFKPLAVPLIGLSRSKNTQISHRRI